MEPSHERLMLTDASYKAGYSIAQAENARLQEQLEEAEGTLELARTYKGIEGRACPLCLYEDGYFKGNCEPHRQLHEARALAERRKDVLETAEAIVTTMVALGYTRTRGIATGPALKWIRAAIEERGADDPHAQCPANAACGQFGDEPCLAPRGKR